MNFLSTQNDLPRRKRQPSARSASPRGANAGAQPRSSPCACGGGCPRCQQTSAMQMKSKVSQPGDALEREADKAAEHVLSTSSSRPSIEGAARAGTSIARTATSSPTPVSAHAATPSSGQPLDTTTREFFEPRFGRDFGDVRIHTGAQAALTAQAVSARAYTVGRDVTFGAGEYAPQSSTGRRLLAHELAHVVQQDTGPAQIMRDPIPTLDPSMLSDVDLMTQMQETRNWLDKHVMLELEYDSMEQYMEALQAEYNTRETPNVSAAVPAVVSGISQSISIPWPPPPEVCVAPSKIGQTMLPDDATNFLIQQRGFTSTAPRTTLDALGKTVVTRDALSPFDPRVFGKELGLGFETHAVIQIYDAKGNIVAEDIGAFFKKGAPHAELQAMSTMLPRLENVDVTGGRMVVIVDQIPCAGQCGPGLKMVAQKLGLETYEVYLPLRESMTEPGVPASPKTSVRGATLPGRPPVGTYLFEGVTFTPNQSNIYSPAIKIPPQPSTMAPTWVDDAFKIGETSPKFLNPNWVDDAFPEYNPLTIPGAGNAPLEFTFTPPKVPWYRGSTVTTIGRIGTGMALGYATNEISLGMIEGSGLKMSEKDKTAFSLGTAALHPGVNIVAAADAIFMEKIIYEPVIRGFYEDHQKKYFEMNPDATPQQYKEDTEYWDECIKGDCPDW